MEEEEDGQDIRLNPALYLPCRDDIKEYCGNLMKDEMDNDSLHGKVINCLQMEYAKGKHSVRFIFLSRSSLCQVYGSLIHCPCITAGPEPELLQPDAPVGCESADARFQTGLYPDARV